MPYPELGPAAAVCPQFFNRPSYLTSSSANLFFTHFSPQHQFGCNTFPVNALANRSQATTEVAAPNQISKPVGAIANANLNAAQSNRKVTKTDIEKTPYPDAWPAMRQLPAAAKTNFKTQESTRMRQSAS